MGPAVGGQGPGPAIRERGGHPPISAGGPRRGAPRPGGTVKQTGTGRGPGRMARGVGPGRATALPFPRENGQGNRRSGAFFFFFLFFLGSRALGQPYTTLAARGAGRRRRRSGDKPVFFHGGDLGGPWETNAASDPVAAGDPAEGQPRGRSSLDPRGLGRLAGSFGLAFVRETSAHFRGRRRAGGKHGFAGAFSPNQGGPDDVAGEKRPGPGPIFSFEGGRRGLVRDPPWAGRTRRDCETSLGFGKETESAGEGDETRG